MTQAETSDTGEISAIALGSNVPSRHGDPRATVQAGMRALGGAGVKVIAESRLYSTPCFPAGAGPDYVNAAALVRTKLGPKGLLAHLHAVEAEFDRQRQNRWAARTLDLDLLFYGDQIAPDAQTYRKWRDLPLESQKTQAPDQLILPHPRIQDRAFVMVPLADIAPEWVHPVLGKPLKELLKQLSADDIDQITVL